MNSFVVEKYVDKQVLNNLNKWTLENCEKEYYSISLMNNIKTRYTTRQCVNNKTDHLFDYPNFVYNIQQKIIEDFNLENFHKAFIGKNGIVNGIGYKNDYICEHTDPTWVENTKTYHFNIISQKPEEGGITIINGIPHDINEGDLLVYNVSDCPHKVTRSNGNIPRILWVFGFCIDISQINFTFNNFFSKSKYEIILFENQNIYK